MKATIDATGRVLLPKALCASAGLTPGAVVEISSYAGGVQIKSAQRTAKVVLDHDGRLVATGETIVDDAVILNLIDTGRR